MLFSIGIPAYKAKYLNECIDSILAQTYKDFELIIVNDASPEDIDSIVNSYSDTRIRYYKNEKNIGAENVVDNWNKCLSYAIGELFVLMGDDDKMEINYLDEFVRLIRKYPSLNIYHCRSFIINEISEKLELTPSHPEYESVYDNILQRISFSRLQFISDFVYNTRILKNNNGFYKQPLAWASDDISSYIAMADKGIAHTNKPIFNYRRNNDTISNTGNVTLKLDAINYEVNWIYQFINERTIKNLNDKLLYKNILDSLQKYKTKKRVLTLSQCMKLGFLKGIIKLTTKKEVKISEKIYAILTYIKTRLL